MEKIPNEILPNREYKKLWTSKQKSLFHKNQIMNNHEHSKTFRNEVLNERDHILAKCMLKPHKVSSGKAVDELGYINKWMRKCLNPFIKYVYKKHQWAFGQILIIHFVQIWLEGSWNPWKLIHKPGKSTSFTSNQGRL